MLFKISPLLALALASKATAIALPQQVASGTASNTDPVADAIAAYEQGAAVAKPPAAAPVGAGSVIIPQDTSKVEAAAAADATAGSITKRAACDAEPSSSYASSSNALSVDDWSASSEFSSAANAATPPSGYTSVPGWQNLAASASAPVYQGFTSSLSSYDPSKCSAKCDAIEGCTSFVIYFAREPTKTPDSSGCPNPPALTRVKCAFYGIPLESSQALNKGQFRASFETRIAGSNAYTSQPPTPAGYQATLFAGDKTINAPDNSYMGVQGLPNSAYNPQACADACSATTNYAATHGGRPCNFFVAYMVFKNGKNPIFTCTYYTRAWGIEYAKNPGQTRNGDVYTNDFVVGYTVNAS